MSKGVKFLILIGAIFLFVKVFEPSGPKSSYAVGTYDPPKTYTQTAPTYQGAISHQLHNNIMGWPVQARWPHILNELQVTNMETKIADLGNYRRQREQRGRTVPVRVLREVDKENANRSYYFILGEAEAAVQSAVDGLIAEVESFGSGYGEFTNPRKHDGLYFAFGEVVVRPDVISEFWK